MHFEKRKGSIPPTERSDTKLRDARVVLNMEGISRRGGGGGSMSREWAGWGAERTHGLCVYFPLMSFPQKFRI